MFKERTHFANAASLSWVNWPYLLSKPKTSAYLDVLESLTVRQRAVQTQRISFLY